MDELQELIERFEEGLISKEEFWQLVIDLGLRELS